MTKTKHPNKGHSPNNGQRPMYQSVRYSETPLYIGKRYIHRELHAHLPLRLLSKMMRLSSIRLGMVLLNIHRLYMPTFIIILL